MFNWFKKKKVEAPPQPMPQVQEEKQEKVEISKLSSEQKIELISAQIEAMNERIKNIERMIEEIYKIAKG
jgi:hypothetical protein